MAKKTYDFLLRWAPAIVWMVLIFLGSSRTRIAVTEVSSLNFLFFKTLHIIEYAVLYITVLRGLSWKKSSIEPESYLLALLWCFLYAGSDELHQTFIPSREGVLRDVFIDTAGMFVGFLLIRQKVIHRFVG